MQKVYSRINWENYPSDETPLNETNLNKMDASIDEIDNRVIAHETTKATKEEVATLIADVIFEESTGIFAITRKNGSVLRIDTKMEKIAVNFSYDKATQQIVLTLIDGTRQHIDLSALITQFEFIDTTTIGFEITTDGKVKATVLDGSITEDKLQSNFLADIKVEVSKAEASQIAATTSATNAKTSETNAKNSEVNAKTSETNAASSATIAENSVSTATSKATAAANSADNASVSENNAAKSATSASDSATNAFNSAASAASSAGTANIKAIASATSATDAANSSTKAESYAVGGTSSRINEDVDNSKYYYEQSKKIFENFNSSGNVAGVKGNNEESYRRGMVNLTAENIGAAKTEEVEEIAKNTVENLIPYPYYDMENTTLGVHWTVDERGVVTANSVDGTDTGVVIQDMVLQSDTEFYEALEDGATYTLTGHPGGGSRTTHTMTAFIYDSNNKIKAEYHDLGEGITFKLDKSLGVGMRICCRIYSMNIKVENFVFKPMLVKSNVKYEFVSPLLSRQNLLDNIEKRIESTTIRNSVDFNTFVETGVYHIAYYPNTNQPCNNHGTLYVESNTFSSYQLFIPDVMHDRMYKRSWNWDTGTWNDTWTIQWLTDTKPRYSMVGQSGESTKNPWYKFASVEIADQFNDRDIVFHVKRTYYDLESCGILRCHVRKSNDSIGIDTNAIKFYWEYASENIVKENYELAYRYENNIMYCDLWCKCDAPYSMYQFDVISEGGRADAGAVWTLYNTITEGSYESIPAGYTQIVSSLLTIANSAEKLSVARTINGVGFDGSANITVFDPANYSYQGSNISASGWYRFFEINGGSSGVLEIDIIRSFNNNSPEAYRLHLAWNQASDKVSIVQLNGIFQTQLVTQIRALKTTGGSIFLEFYYEGNSKNFVCTRVSRFLPISFTKGKNITHTLTSSIPSGYTENTFTLSNKPIKAGTMEAITFSGNATSATKLATARKIGEVSFDGTSDITLKDVLFRGLASEGTIQNTDNYEYFLVEYAVNDDFNRVNFQRTDFVANYSYNNISFSEELNGSAVHIGGYIYIGNNKFESQGYVTEGEELDLCVEISAIYGIKI